MDKDYYAKRLLQLFPQYEDDYNDSIDDGQLLGHVFFGAINPILSDLLKKNIEQDKIRKYIDFIEEMYLNGDNDVKNIVEVTIMEYLGDDETVLRNAFLYISEELMQVSKEVEAYWGRRDIHIYHESGKVMYGWIPVK